MAHSRIPDDATPPLAGSGLFDEDPAPLPARDRSRWPLNPSDLESGLSGGEPQDRAGHDGHDGHDGLDSPDAGDEATAVGVGSTSRRGTGTTTATATFSLDHPDHGPGHSHNPDHAPLARASTHRLTFTTRAKGDSGRSGFHAQEFIRVALRSNSKVSAAVNVLWPVVPVALACRYGLTDTPGNHLTTFILVYISMVPCANMVGFAGQELSRKVPHVLGVLTETTVASIVEIVLFIVLMTRGLFGVIQAAILGSVLATMLLCLGLCFFVGGLQREEQEFSETVSEAGSGLLLTAGFGLAIPTFFQHTLAGGSVSATELAARTLNISRMSALLLIMSYGVYIFFQMRTHHGIFDEIFESDEQRGAEEKAKHREHVLQQEQQQAQLERQKRASENVPSPEFLLPHVPLSLPLPSPTHAPHGDHHGSHGSHGKGKNSHEGHKDSGEVLENGRPPAPTQLQRAWTRVRHPCPPTKKTTRKTKQHRSLEQAKLTMTEALVALAVSVALVSLMALSLVEEIAFIAEEHGVSDAFMGLILVPLVEKAAEHLTAVDEAWDNQMNFALAHVLGATLQTAMFNGPVAVILGWCTRQPMGLDFNLFDMSVLLLAIITVGNFLRDQKSNYLEGLLCVVVYISIAVAAYNYPNTGGVVASGGSEGGSMAEARSLLAAMQWRG